MARSALPESERSGTYHPPQPLVQPVRLGEIGDGVIAVACQSFAPTLLTVGFDSIRLEPDGLSEVGDGLVEFTRLGIAPTSTVARGVIFRIAPINPV